MKLWKNKSSNQSIEAAITKFTVGSDLEWDVYLAESDVIGSIAHIRMLASIQLITQAELKQLEAALSGILETIQAGKFCIEEGVEDVHSQIELLLTRELGDVGKKIHSGRSRNDQSLVDIKLFLRKEIKAIAEQIQLVFSTLQRLSELYQSDFLPGYTHMQLAMPSSFGLWFGAYAESLSDDLELLVAAQQIINKNPLGSGAGYGSSFPLNRTQTTEELKFESLNYNVVYAQMTRGKAEKIMAMAMASTAATLSKFAMDCCLFMNQHFGFIHFPDEFTTGSSIMPHKKNPDVFELIRAKCNRIQALPNELILLTNNLTVGYHRDFQLTKECLFPRIIDLKSCLEMMDFMLQHIQIEKDILSNPIYESIFSVELVNQYVLQGMSFRDAYHRVSDQIKAGTFTANTALSHTHEGSIGNLCTIEIRKRFDKIYQHFID